MSWKAAGLVVLVACGCSVQTLSVNEESRADNLFELTANWPAFVQAPAGQAPRGTIDILFMVDNTSSMGALQGQLLAGFDAFMYVLDDIPGGTPDMHIGVVSSDLGAGDGSIEHCDATGGDRGRLQRVQNADCGSGDMAPRFLTISEATGMRVTNFSRPLPQEFACLARLGEAGCGFEQPFAAVKHALDPALAPAENLGFLRREASLAVIMISNEDDCSAAPGVPLYETSVNRNITSRLGPPTNFRCNEFGHLCRGSAPPRTATGLLRDCQSNETGGTLESITSFVDFLRGLKSDPAKVFVATVAGPPTPYQVRVKPATIRRHGGLARDRTFVHDGGRRRGRSGGPAEPAHRHARPLRPFRIDLRRQHVHAAAPDREPAGEAARPGVRRAARHAGLVSGGRSVDRRERGQTGGGASALYRRAGRDAVLVAGRRRRLPRDRAAVHRRARRRAPPRGPAERDRLRQRRPAAAALGAGQRSGDDAIVAATDW